MLKIFHLILAFNILLSSSGIMVFEHLCQMRGKKISWFVQPKSCCNKSFQFGEFGFEKRHKNDTQEQITRIPCCSDKSSFQKTSPNPTLQKSVQLGFSTGLLIMAQSQSSLLDFNRSKLPHNQKILRFYLYKPPPKLRDIPVFVQSFRC